ncbi:MAG: hypothetical protein J0L92_01610 [Deltaproteobacteria bacterium]|nr:hypothetical protein [Deltaproteobacteria bacterium]
MARSHLSLVVLALVGCGSAGETPTTSATPSTPPTAAPSTAETPAAQITPTQGTTAEGAAQPAVAAAVAQAAGDIGHAGWAERERRTFVLQGAARGNAVFLDVARGGTHVAVASESGFVTMVDAATGEVRASERIARSSNAWFDLDVVGDVAVIAWGAESGDAGVDVWRWRAGTRLDVKAVNELVDVGSRVALSPRGDRFVLGSADDLRVGTTNSGRLTTRVEGDHRGTLSWPHANAIVEEVDDDVPNRMDVHVFDPRTLAEVWTTSAEDVAVVRPAGDRIVVLDGPSVIVRALPGGEERARFAHGLSDPKTIVVSREGDRVVVSNETMSVMILLADGARTEIPMGRARWVSPRNVLVEADDGSIRRWVLDRARLGAHVVPPRVEGDPDYGEEVSNEVAIDAAGTVVSARGSRVEIVEPSGTHHELAEGGEHSVWSTSLDPARTGLAIGGRFGVQSWRGSGVVDTHCRGATSSLVVAWPEARLVSDDCDLAGRELARGERHVPFATTEDARFVVEEDGSFVDRATSRRVQLEGQDELHCYGGDDCSGTASIAPAGTAVVLQLYYGEDDVQLVHETANGRRVGTMPYEAMYTFAPDGAWLAYAWARSLRLIGLVGETHEARTLVESSGADDTLAVTALAPSPDGRSLAWTPGNGHRVSVVSVSDGHETWHTSVGAPVVGLRWSPSGSQLAVRTEHEIRIVEVGTDTPPRSLRAAHGSLEIACSERVLRWIRPSSTGAFEVIDLGACAPGQTLPRLVADEQLVWIDEGMVRVRRLDDGSELVLRTLHEDAARRHHLAHDSEGHWWTDEPATDAAPVPTWVRHGDGHGGETTPLDPAMRRDDLLARFFAAR